MKINNEIKIIIGIVVVCILLMAVFVKFAPNSSNLVRDPSLLVRENSYMTGKIGAKVTLVEFSDYECPACAALAPVIKDVVDSYKDNPDFNFAFRNFPLSQHANAVITAEAAEAAGVQGKFWEMNELLYKNQEEWASVINPIDLLVGYAKSLNLDILKFRQDVEQRRFASVVQADLRDAENLALDHTPFFFLNGVEVKDLSTLRSQIDTALAK